MLSDTKKDLPWMEKPNVMETWVSDVLPPHELVTAVFGFALKDGKLLLGEFKSEERVKNSRFDMVGGHVEKGESFEDALAREFIEEVSVRIKPLNLLGYFKLINLSPNPQESKYPYPESYMLVYKCDIIEELEFKENTETSGRGYFSRDELKKSNWCTEHINFIEQTIGKELC